MRSFLRARPSPLPRSPSPPRHAGALLLPALLCNDRGPALGLAPPPAVVFLIALADPQAPTSWTAWANAASMGVACVGIGGLQMRYRRLAVDTGAPVAETGCWFDRRVGCY